MPRASADEKARALLSPKRGQRGPRLRRSKGLYAEGVRADIPRRLARFDSAQAKVVVTGGSGQLGTLVLERLVAARGHRKIVSLDLVPPMLPSPRIDWRIADMRDPGLERHLEGADALVHLAFIVAKSASEETMEAVNVEGSKRIFEAAARHGVRRIVYASSVAAYGIMPGLPVPIVESTPRWRSRILTYAANKHAVEEYLDEFDERYPETSVVRLRPGILVGRRIAHVSPRLLERRVMPVFGEARGPIVWDEDVADAVVLALGGDAHGAYNLVASDPLTAEEMARLSGFRALRIPSAVTAGAAKVTGALGSILGEKRVDFGWFEAARHDMIVSAARARNELGWKPRYPTSADVAIALGKHTRTRPDPRIRLFLSMLPRLSRREQKNMPEDARSLSLAIHLDVTGPRGQDFVLALDEGKITVKPGVARPPDASLTLGDETFLELLSGHTDTATAAMIGKIVLRGEPTALMVLRGIVDAFRRATEAEGTRGRIARGLSSVFERGRKTE
jgi:UDP-glucose 4-epimerase